MDKSGQLCVDSAPSYIYKHSFAGFHTPKTFAELLTQEELGIKITFVVRGCNLFATAAEHLPLLFPRFHIEC